MNRTPDDQGGTTQQQLEQFMQLVRKRHPHEEVFHQAVREVAESVLPYTLSRPEYQEARVLERLTEPDRIVSFRVCWEDDKRRVRINRAWRVQLSNAIGPYKGGLRFHPSVNESVLKFLAFEQVFKNALTGLPMGGAKGGSDFDPKGKSDTEVMRFCQSFMAELHRHIGPMTDTPAGDIGVGQREIGYLFGAYNRMVGHHAGVLTGKDPAYGGSLIRTEATGYGAVYFAKYMLERLDETLHDKTAVVSGSGNVAIYAAERLTQLGAKVLTLSDSDGFVHDPDGIDEEKLAYVKDLKEVRRGRISEYAEQYPRAEFHVGDTPWHIAADLAFPCATQNELDADDAQVMIDHGLRLVSEGANMPCTLDAIEAFQRAGVLFGPAKAANAGGVAVSGLEQSQNAQRLFWTAAEVDAKLREIMFDIHERCVEAGRTGDGERDRVDYVRGANLAGFQKVADALLAYGVV